MLYKRLPNLLRDPQAKIKSKKGTENVHLVLMSSKEANEESVVILDEVQKNRETKTLLVSQRKEAVMNAKEPQILRRVTSTDSLFIHKHTHVEKTRCSTFITNFLDKWHYRVMNFTSESSHAM